MTYYAKQAVFKDDLMHYGRLGMKWGQHIFGDIKLKYNMHKNKKEYNQYTDRLADHYTSQGEHQKSFAKSKVNPNVMDADTANALYGSGKDFTLSKSTKMYRITLDSGETYSDKDRVYAVANTKDLINYMTYPEGLSYGRNFEDIKVNTIQSSEDYKVAGRDTIRHAIAQSYTRDEIKQMLPNLEWYTSNKMNGLRIDDNFMSSKMANKMLMDHKSDSKLIKTLRSMGYTAMVDIEDQDYTGGGVYNADSTVTPTILFNTKKLRTTNSITYDDWWDTVGSRTYR